jgi:hypothetical protein
MQEPNSRKIVLVNQTAGLYNLPVSFVIGDVVVISLMTYIMKVVGPEEYATAQHLAANACLHITRDVTFVAR